MSVTSAKHDIDRASMRGRAQLEDVPLTAMAFPRQEWYGIVWNYDRIYALVQAENEKYATEEETSE